MTIGRRFVCTTKIIANRLRQGLSQCQRTEAIRRVLDAAHFGTRAVLPRFLPVFRAAKIDDTAFPSALVMSVPVLAGIRVLAPYRFSATVVRVAGSLVLGLWFVAHGQESGESGRNSGGSRLQNSAEPRTQALRRSAFYRVFGRSGKIAPHGCRERVVGQQFSLSFLVLGPSAAMGPTGAALQFVLLAAEASALGSAAA